MFRIVICSSALIALIFAVKTGLRAVFDHFGFGAGVGIGLFFIAICGIIAFSVDYVEGKSSR